MCLNLNADNYGDRAPFTMPPLPQGKAEHQQGSLPACSDHWDGAAMQAGTCGSPIGFAAKDY